MIVPEERMKTMLYTGKNLQEISFPLGGIGTGSIGLAGNGCFVDWEILDQIKQSKNQLTQTETQIENLVHRLESMEEATIKQQEALEKRIEELVLQAE